MVRFPKSVSGKTWINPGSWRYWPIWVGAVQSLLWNSHIDHHKCQCQRRYTIRDDGLYVPWWHNDRQGIENYMVRKEGKGNTSANWTSAWACNLQIHRRSISIWAMIATSRQQPTIHSLPHQYLKREWIDSCWWRSWPTVWEVLGQNSDWFGAEQGVRQACVMSLGCSICWWTAMKKFVGGVQMAATMGQLVPFADGLMLVEEKDENVESNIWVLDEVMKNWKMRVNGGED